MELNYSKIFNKETLGSVESFCKLNNIDDIDSFIKNVFQEGFNIKKYGLLGKTLNEGEKNLKTGGIEEKRVEIEVIREIRVEVPVEVIKEVEKIVTKIEYISDKNGETELLSKIEHLNEEVSIKTTEIDKIRQEFSTKTTEMESFFQNEMSKKDLELDELRRNLDINSDDNKVKMLQQTVQNLTSEVRDLKKKNEELNKQMLEKPIESDFTRARFHGSSNLNNDLYK
jgi:predicted RNase H-like nuclease (RuvC/YqgF family)